MTKRQASESSPVWGSVIVAAGSSSRFGGEVPKQFLDLHGRRVVDWSLQRALALPRMSEVVLVVPVGWEEAFEPEPGSENSPRLTVVTGGELRQDSVRSGIAALEKATHVLVHDGARPLASSRLWTEAMDACESSGAAVPVLPVFETVKRVRSDGSIEETVDRTSLRLAQTPQAFVLESLSEALEKAADAGGERASSLTDDSALVENLCGSVSTIPGERTNIKITRQEDLVLASLLLDAGSLEQRRTGLGFDSHPFEAGRPLVVGGCRFEDSDVGLSGHSDGDVLLHAICDSLLAAAGLGDIGVLYPPDEEKWRGADSADLLAGVIDLIGEQGWSIRRIDATLIGNRPIVSRERGRLIGRIASICGLPREMVWVKGTTGNEVGFAGRGEGLASIALAEVERSADRSRESLMDGGPASSSD